MNKKKQGLRTIDLYAGAGGMAYGFQLAGFNIIAAFDNWNPAIETLEKNFDKDIIKMDLDNFDDDVTPFGKYDPEVIIGGPPCQDFSHAGKRNEDGGKGKLTVTFAEIVAAVKPKWFIMENVARIRKTRKLIIAKKTLKKARYGLTEIVLDASYCGVPQKRKRYFLIGELNGVDDALLPYLKDNLSIKSMTVREYMGNKLEVEHYYRHPRTYSRRAIFSVDEPSPTIRGVNRPIPSTYKLHPNDSSTSLEDVRPLTTKERSCIQTFPEDYIFVGAKTTKETLIGNAVPVKLAEYVANSIISYIRDEKKDRQTTMDNENYSLEKSSNC